jgi:LPXTG-motif cell wall-anchored protein
MIAFLLIPLILVNVINVTATETSQSITFVLHKRLFTDEEDALDRQNSGLEITDEEDYLLGKSVGLPDVEFEVYDATEFVAQQLLKGKKVDSIMQEVLDSEYAWLREELKDKKLIIPFTIKTDSEGVAWLPLSDKEFSSFQESNPALLFLEKEGNQNIRKIALPMLVVLPVTNPQGEILETIHLYPKNVLPDKGGEDPEPTPKPKPTVPSGRLPQTGEAKTFMGVSGLLIVGAVGVIWYKRRTKKEGQ